MENLIPNAKLFADIGEEIGKIKDKLIPSWLSFVVQLAAFIVLLVIVILVAYKPVKKMIKKRQDYIEDNIREAEQNKALAKQSVLDAKEMVIASRKEANEIIDKAKLDAENSRQKSIESTKLEIQKMKLDAQKDIEKSQQDALDDIHKEMVDVALMASSEILKREVNEKDNTRLTEEFIKNLE